MELKWQCFRYREDLGQIRQLGMVELLNDGSANQLVRMLVEYILEVLSSLQNVRWKVRIGTHPPKIVS